MMPLNIDWQQILLHWMNLAILTGGLYFLLYRPVKKFMEQRAAHYSAMEEQAQGKMREAQELLEQYRQKLDGAEEEAREIRVKAQRSAQEAADAQLAEAEAEAKRIVAHAQTEAESSRAQARQEAQHELRELAAAAAQKLVLRQEDDAFDRFLDAAEGGMKRES